MLSQAWPDSFDFCISNDDIHVEDDDDTWTFESSMGARQRMDFMFCSRCFHSVFGHASSFLDMDGFGSLGSDFMSPIHTAQTDNKKIVPKQNAGNSLWERFCFVCFVPYTSITYALKSMARQH